MRGVAPLLLTCAALPVLAGCSGSEVPADQIVFGGDERAGRVAVAALECGVCHDIPGIDGADGIVGPSLEDFGRRKFIAGVLPNDPQTLQIWVKEAPSLIPETGMPDLPVSDAQARDIAAYLFTLR